ncbi:MAG: hypothetical protein KKD36_13820 [Bacteroidetes bacterium]|nr:hypothetical protein [Bacteroidota bacterium]
MAINYKETFKTVSITKSELNSMINAQEKGLTYLNTNESNSSTIAAGLVGFVGTVLALVFFKKTNIGVGAGISSLVTSASSSMKQSVSAQGAYGKEDLLETFRTMTNLGAVSVNMDVAYVTVYDQATLATVVTFVQGLAANYYTLANGTKVY